jgi:hypothetical protein
MPPVDATAAAARPPVRKPRRETRDLTTSAKLAFSEKLLISLSSLAMCRPC